MTIKTVLSVLGVNHFDEDLKGAIDFAKPTVPISPQWRFRWAQRPPIGSYEVVSTVWIEERQREIDRLADKASEIKAILARSEASFEVQEIYTEFAWRMKILQSGHYMPISSLSALKPPVTKNFGAGLSMAPCSGRRHRC